MDIFSLPMDDLTSLAAIPGCLKAMHADLAQMRGAYDVDMSIVEQLDELEDAMSGTMLCSTPLVQGHAPLQIAMTRTPRQVP